MAPFIFIIQFLAAKKLVILPHSSFNRLAAEVGDPTDRKVTFVNMTARCGSTLLGQMISRTPKAFVMSEPWAWMHIHGHYIGNDISMAEYKRLLRSAVRLQCKREHTRDVEHIFIKTVMYMSPAFPMLREMFPKAKFIFNTRGFKSTVESMMQLVKFQPALVTHTGAFFWVRLNNAHFLHKKQTALTFQHSNFSFGGDTSKFLMMIHFSMIYTRNGRQGIPHERSGSLLDSLLRYDIYPV